jgi:hypothetical protein
MVGNVVRWRKQEIYTTFVLKRSNETRHLRYMGNISVNIFLEITFEDVTWIEVIH